MFFVFLRLQLKRTFRHLPLLLTGAMLLLLLTGSIAFLSSQKLYGDAIIGRMEFGVVYPESHDAEEVFIEALAQQETLKDMTRFRTMTEADGRRDLAEGKIQGLLILPDGFVSGVLSGVNTPARLVLNQNQALQARLLVTLTEAGARTLSVSQGALYAAWDEYISRGIAEADRQTMNQAVNERYLSLALGRDRMFRMEVLQATGELDPLSYFLASWMVLFLLLMGMLEAFVMRPLSEGLKTRLTIEGIGSAQRIFTDWFRLFLLQLLLLGLMAGLWQTAAQVLDLSWTFRAEALSGLLLLAAGVAALILLIYTLTEDLLSGMLLLFALSFVMVFLSGGFLPSSFLPGILRQIQPWVPSTAWIRVMGSFLTSGTQPLLTSGLFAAGFYSLALLADRSRSGRRYRT